MIADIWKDIENAMKKIGYIITDDEETLRARRYIIKPDIAMSANDNRGTFKGGHVRIDRTIHLRLQYVDGKRDYRRLLDIAIDQETIIPDIYALSAGCKFIAANIEDLPGGKISDLEFEFSGTITM